MESDCTPDFNTPFSLYLHYESEDTNSLLCAEGQIYYNYTCYSCTEKLLFDVARNRCLDAGGDLAFLNYNDDLRQLMQYSCFSDSMWIRGSPWESRYASPYVLNSDLELHVLNSDMSSTKLLNKTFNGLCAYSPRKLCSSLVPVITQVSKECPINECVNGGTCWALVGEAVMCDCPQGSMG